MRGLFTYLFLGDTFQENINCFNRIFLFLNHFKEGVFVGNLFPNFNVIFLVENPTSNGIDGIFIQILTKNIVHIIGQHPPV